VKQICSYYFFLWILKLINQIVGSINFIKESRDFEWNIWVDLRANISAGKRRSNWFMDFFSEDLQLTWAEFVGDIPPWHSIEKIKGVYDWKWMDRVMAKILHLGSIRPILDPLHHTSFPEWLKDGFGDAEFVNSYVRFVTALAVRYSWRNITRL